MILFKTCPRCLLGDVEIERDLYGWCAICLQCGYVKDLTEPSEASPVLARERREREPIAQPA